RSKNKSYQFGRIKIVVSISTWSGVVHHWCTDRETCRCHCYIRNMFINRRGGRSRATPVQRRCCKLEWCTVSSLSSATYVSNTEFIGFLFLKTGKDMETVYRCRSNSDPRRYWVSHFSPLKYISCTRSRNP